MEEKKVSFVAKVGKITESDCSGVGRMALEDIQVDGEFFRDHTWIRLNRQINNLNLKRGDMISGTAKLFAYQDIEDKNREKYGLKKLRNLSKGDGKAQLQV